MKRAAETPPIRKHPLAMSEPSSCPLEVTQREFAQIVDAEAVVVREYERADSSRFACVIAYGRAEEMEDLAKRSEIILLPVGVHVVCQQAIRSVELLRQNSDVSDPSGVSDE